VVGAEGGRPNVAHDPVPVPDPPELAHLGRGDDRSKLWRRHRRDRSVDGPVHLLHGYESGVPSRPEPLRLVDLTTPAEALHDPNPALPPDRVALTLRSARTASHCVAPWSWRSSIVR
jgi:hypothetical protein